MLLTIPNPYYIHTHIRTQFAKRFRIHFESILYDDKCMRSTFTAPVVEFSLSTIKRRTQSVLSTRGLSRKQFVMKLNVVSVTLMENYYD